MPSRDRNNTRRYSSRNTTNNKRKSPARGSIDNRGKTSARSARHISAERGKMDSEARAKLRLIALVALACIAVSAGVYFIVDAVIERNIGLYAQKTKASTKTMLLRNLWIGLMMSHQRALS